MSWYDQRMATPQGHPAGPPGPLDGQPAGQPEERPEPPPGPPASPPLGLHLARAARDITRAFDDVLASVIWSCALLAGFSLLAVGQYQRISR